MNEKVLIGMSGGVDSSVAAFILKNQGYDVIGVTLKMFCDNDSTMETDAKRVCDFLNIPYYSFNVEEEFRNHVVNDFICQYKNCKTPNPCIECNKHFKFGFMYEKAKELGCKYIATGHYAKIEFSEKYNSYVIKKSNAGQKDQSYVLYSIDKNLLDKIKFPLGEFSNKDEIRKIAIENNIPTANKKDSEDICFIPDGDYKKFLEENSDISANVGSIVDKNGRILGKHQGLYRHTIGQRKGLGIANKTPLFVLGFNKEKNELIVGDEKDLYTQNFYVKDFNLLLPIKDFDNKIKVEVKTRYTAKPIPGTITKENDEILVELDEPQRAVTSGQSAVFYVDDVVLGGGKIK